MKKSKTSDEMPGASASRRDFLSGLISTAASPALAVPALSAPARSPIWSRVERMRGALNAPKMVDEINAGLRGMLMPVVSEDDLAAKRALLAAWEEITAGPDRMGRIRIEHDAIGLTEMATACAAPKGTAA